MGGQKVTGRVLVRLAREKRIRGIYLRFKGRAEVEWTESRSSSNSEGESETVHDHYSAKEEYFENNFYVVGGPNADMKLRPGEYIYPFILILPPSLPSSFEGEHGHVRYTVEGVISRPWRFDHKCKAAFTVIGILDLNEESQYLGRVQKVIEKDTAWCCCPQRPLALIVTLSSRGFVPGQRCEVTVEVNNPSYKGITLKCLLVQSVKYSARGGHSKSSRCEKATNREGIRGRIEGYESRSRTWTSHMDIPPLPPSYLQHCSCIDISYSIVVKGILNGLHRDIIVEIPVIIGSIPLRTQFASIAPSAPLPDNQPSSPNNLLSNYPEIPPPSYEESVSGKVNIREKDDNEYVKGDLQFSPYYPVYRFAFHH